MTWLYDLFITGSVAGSVLIIMVVATAGLLLGSLRIFGIGLGIAGVLFSGLLIGHLGAVVSPEVLEFARDFGLVLFVYAVGIQVGPSFLATFRRHGLPLNLVVIGSVIFSTILAAVISRVAKIEVPAAVGMLSGAVTNTPSLGAAQTALGDIPGVTREMSQLPGLGYAVSYPFGVLGPIFVILLSQPLFRKLRNNGTPVDTIMSDSAPSDSNSPSSMVGLVLPMVTGILLGVLVGALPVPIKGLPAPLRLGMAGGPLVVAIILGARGRFGPLDWRLSPAAGGLLRDFGVVIFLACVGLISGKRFVETLIMGDGLKWMGYSLVITSLPLVLIVLVTRYGLKKNYATTCGILAGSETNPAALAFGATHTHSDEVTLAYATVYPLTMVLRVLATQVFVLLLMR
jgi:AspT/YidE/YbjL antiporter-like protein